MSLGNSMPLASIVQADRKITYGIVQPGGFVDEGVPLVRGGDYSDGWSELGEIKRVRAEIDAPYRRSKLKSGDILLTIVGANTGNVAVVPDYLDGANITQTTARIAVDEKLASRDFIFYVLQSSIGQREVYRFIKGGAQPGLNLEDVKKFTIPSIPLAEQERIVEILSDADAAINAAEKSLAQGELELIGITEKLVEKDIANNPIESLGALAKFENGFGYRSGDVLDDGSGYPLISLANFSMGGGYKVGDFKTLIEQPGDRYQAAHGDILIANTEVTRAGEIIGAPLICPESAKTTYYSTDVSKLSLSPNVLAEYLEMVLMTRAARRHMRRMANGSTVLHLDITGASKFHIPLSSLEAQQSAIEIRNESRQKILLMKQQLAALKKQKRGLMQQLLTGKLRVPEQV